MSFRRTGHSDERRRRVLRDELRGSTGEEESGEAAGDTKRRGRATDTANQRRYSAAALAGRQAPVTCLIPKSGWTLAALALLGLSIVAGLEALYVYVYCALPADRQALCSALDVERTGSLMAWCSALVLAAGAAGSIMVFTVRRHRLDDYRARYRVWLWTAGVFLLGSADVATALHVGLARLAGQLQGDRLQLSEQAWSWVIVGLGFGLVGLRMVMEMRASLSALTVTAVAATAYTAAGCMAADALPIESPPLRAMAYSACLLVGHGSLLLAVMSYARFVFHAAQGGAGQRSRKKTKDVGSEEATSGSSRTPQARLPRNTRLDSAHSTDLGAAKAPMTAPVQFNASSQEQEDEDEESDDEGEQSNLSRSERRRLRKQMRRQTSSGR
jgi:hypothetical protein